MKRPGLLGILIFFLAASAQHLVSQEKGHILRNPKIVGGRDASADEFPWMVGIVDKSLGSNFQGHFCGGALIQSRWVVTAAHCVVSETPSSIIVLVGTNNLDSGGQRMPVRQIIIHPGYNDSTLNNDIALIELAVPVFGSWVRLIDDDRLDDPGVEATVMGWGALGEEEFRGDVAPVGFDSQLKVAELMIVSNAVANPVHGNSLNSNMLAAGASGGGVDTCGGDSGGPLLVANPDSDDEEFLLAGITSFGATGVACGTPGGWGIYTRVSVYRDWVYEHVFPHYLAWEKEYAVMGENRDHDGDGCMNFAEFAFGTDPTSSSSNPSTVPMMVEDSGMQYPGIQFLRRITDEVDYTVEYSTDLDRWEAIDLAAHVVDTLDLENGFQRITVRGPTSREALTGGQAYFQIGVRAGVGQATEIVPPAIIDGPEIQLGESIEGELDQADAIDPQYLPDIYYLDHFFYTEERGGGGLVTVTLSSLEVDTWLEVFESTAGDRVAFNNDIPAQAETNSEVTFFAEAGATYQLNATSAQERQEGLYRLTVFN